MELFEFLQRQIQQRLVLIQAMRHQPPNDRVRIPERHAALDQIIRTVRRVREAAGRALLHHVLAESDGAQHGGEHGQPLHQRVARIKKCFLILLHVLVVRQRQPFHRRQQPH